MENNTTPTVLLYLAIGTRPFEHFFDKEREMVRVGGLLYGRLTDAEHVDNIRRTLKTWFLAFMLEEDGPGPGPGDTELFDALDEALLELYNQTLYREILQSHNTPNDSKQ